MIMWLLGLGLALVLGNHVLLARARGRRSRPRSSKPPEPIDATVAWYRTAGEYPRISPPPRDQLPTVVWRGRTRG